MLLSNYLNSYSKTVPWFAPMYKEGNELCIIYPLRNLIWHTCFKICHETLSVSLNQFFLFDLLMTNDCQSTVAVGPDVYNDISDVCCGVLCCESLYCGVLCCLSYSPNMNPYFVQVMCAWSINEADGCFRSSDVFVIRQSLYLRSYTFSIVTIHTIFNALYPCAAQTVRTK